MTKANPLLEGLDEAVSRGTPESRERALWHATDLMTAGHRSEDEIETFGAVIGRLADEIEVAARVQLAKRLAPFHEAPGNIPPTLSFYDSLYGAAHSSPRLPLTIRSRSPDPSSRSPNVSNPTLWSPTPASRASRICSRSRNGK